MDKRIIIDFDNTMGVRGCDIDDGLALLFLLGTEGVRVEAACTAFGNSSIDVVHDNTARMLREWDLDIPVHRGAGAPDEEPSEAARFLAEAAAASPGELAVVATGSMSNLGQAARLDPAFFSNLCEVSLMGGITESLVINGRIMNELNLSCDPAATAAVLGAQCPVTAATAQACLPAFFSRADFVDAFGEGSWLLRACGYWFADMGERYVWDGFTCWGVVAAASVARPDLFGFEEMDITLNERLFHVRYLEHARPRRAERTHPHPPHQGRPRLQGRVHRSMAPRACRAAGGVGLRAPACVSGAIVSMLPDRRRRA